MLNLKRRAVLLFCVLALALPAFGQSLGASGTVQGSVLDPLGSPLQGATVEIRNPVSAYERRVDTDESGNFGFTDVPFNPYHLTVTATGFRTLQQDVSVRSSVPIILKFTLQIATSTTTVTVQGEAGDLVELTPTFHTDVDRSLIQTLPQENQTSGLSAVLTNATPGVVADSNGFFHPLGEHADTSLSLDNQPVTDQQGKLFSNQLALDTIQSIEVVSGSPPAEFGDKTSLIVNAATRSGLGQTKPTGSLSALYGSFGTWAENFTLGLGGKKWGNFLAANSTGTSRFLDSPEFTPFHDKGNAENVFDRIDFQPTTGNTLHLNLSAARSWFQTPNTYDQLAVGQDQHSQIRSLNVAPGWTHLFSPTTLLTFNPFFRVDHARYLPSRNFFSDSPATVGQDRRLANVGFRADVSYSHGIHNAKVGVQFWHDILTENFFLGLTDPTFNPICLNAGGTPVTEPTLTNPQDCSGAGFQPNPKLSPGLIPFDLTRGGQLFNFHGHADIKEEAVYAQDSVKLRNFTLNGGIRADKYEGLSRGHQLEPRLGISYLVKPTTTVLRISYARLFETPYNENLILSSATGAGGLASHTFGAFGSVPLQTGRRNQFNAGFEQPINRLVVVDADYFYKRTSPDYDFDALFNSPITFPISWRKSKIDGVSVRVNLTDVHGLTAYSVLGHTRSRFFGPEVGGLIFNSPLSVSVFRIDHDEVFEQSTHVQYQPKKGGPWVALTWRYDSGAVAGSVPDYGAALALDGDQQAAIGLFCGNVFATVSNPLTSCASPNFGARRVRIPKAGTVNNDTNPPRIAPRHLFDVSTGIENLFHTDRPRFTLQLSAINVTNRNALYNFLSTFSGTHFVQPRTFQVELGLIF